MLIAIPFVDPYGFAPDSNSVAMQLLLSTGDSRGPEALKEG
jgi:hypothetical protein